MNKTLNARIAEFYNGSTDLWLHNWGEHMHHGHYGENGEVAKENKDAQVDMIEELLEFAQVNSAKNIVDLGCGVGGSARHLSRKFDASVLGCTLSSVQFERGQEMTQKAGLEDKVTLVERDMMKVGRSQYFDLVWSLESAEHIENKAGLLQHVYQMLEADGKLIMVTWCVSKSYEEMTPAELNLIKNIQRWYHLPELCTIQQLAAHLESSGFKEIKSSDWSKAVAPFWKAVLRSAFTFRGLTGLLKSNRGTLLGAWAIRYMHRGFDWGLIKYGVVTAVK